MSEHERVESLEAVGIPGGSPGLPVAPELGGSVTDGPEPRSQWQLFRSRFLKHRLAVVSGVVLLLLVVACFGARWIAPYPKNQQDLLLGPVGPSGAHWFGTDDLGRDMLTEILYAGQTSLRIGFTVALLSTLLGTLVGALAGSVLDTKSLGFDAAFPAAFLAMLPAHLRTSRGRAAAATGAVVCLALTPFVPVGVAILVAVVGVLFGVRP